jgi:Tle cognate immunity protein 4 C-terminal domain/Tle cognate immunity protein 4 N-terminal domain
VNTVSRLYVLLAAFPFLLLLGACDKSSSRSLTDKPMAKAALLNLTSNLTPYCFGRHVIDLPKDSTIAWNNTTLGSLGRLTRSIRTDLNGARKLRDDKVTELSKPQYQQSPLLSYTEVLTVPGWDVHLILFREDTGSKRADSAQVFAWRDGVLFIITESVYPDDDLKELNRRFIEGLQTLSTRANNSTPSGPGFCVSNGLSNSSNNNRESTELTVHFKSMADVTLKISTLINGDKLEEKDLIQRNTDAMGIAFKLAGAIAGQAIKTLKSGNIEINGIKSQEVLTRLTIENSEKQKITQQVFKWEALGAPNSYRFPMLNIELRTGADFNTGDAINSSLTDEEAIVLWQAINRTIRQRTNAVAG